MLTHYTTIRFPDRNAELLAREPIPPEDRRLITSPSSFFIDGECRRKMGVIFVRDRSLAGSGSIKMEQHARPFFTPTVNAARVQCQSNLLSLILGPLDSLIPMILALARKSFPAQYLPAFDRFKRIFKFHPSAPLALPGPAPLHACLIRSEPGNVIVPGASLSSSSDLLKPRQESVSRRSVKCLGKSMR